MNLKQRRKVYNRDFHALLHTLEFDNVIEIPAQSIVQIKAFVPHIQVEMREEVFFLMRGVRPLSEGIRLRKSRQSLSLLAVEKPRQGISNVDSLGMGSMQLTV